MKGNNLRNFLQNSFICHSIGVLGTLLFIHVITGFRDNLPITVINSMWLVSCAYITTSITIPKITNYLLVDRKFYILPVLASVYSIVMTVILLFRIDYSREILLYGFCFNGFWMYFSTAFRGERYKLKFKAINNFNIDSLHSKHAKLDITLLESLDLNLVSQGLVVDLHGQLTPEQEKFIADCSVHNIPVFHSESIREMVEGRVTTSHLSENAIGTLLPNPIYHSLKRVWESALILLTLPLSIPLMAITAMLIRLESRGPVLFVQERVGQAGKPFKIYKFRSMTVKTDKCTDKFATQEQARVTRVGKVIRKIRVDELPQFFNVLKGEMALIGPRPEQESFVKQFEKEIPFYGYRHMVKPGITGWAQTVQGYTDDTDSTREKLAHDLYYIKHLSFWLDMNIVLKTIKTMMTGFGAK